MEASALRHTRTVGAHGRSPLLRLQSDERLVALTRRGNHHAFEALVARYQARLLAFCRHMLGSREDAEDVLQEVFAAAFNAMLADERNLNVRPWLYRIARNRSLNHLRRTTAVGVDSMDVHLSEGGLTTADKVHRREDFRMLIADVQELPETQRTALLLREIDALAYEQIAEAMDTTVPSVKSLLVRARVGLAEAAEARLLSCVEVREELGAVAEGLARTSAPVRRHLRTCDACRTFRRHLRSTNRALAAVLPVGPLLVLKKLLLAHLGTTAAAGGGAAAATGGAAAATGGSMAAGGGSVAAGGLLQAGLATAASKAAAGLAAAAIVTAGAVEVKHVARSSGQPQRGAAQHSAAHHAPAPPARAPHPAGAAPAAAHAPAVDERARPAARPAAEEAAPTERRAAPAKATVTPMPTATPDPTATTGGGQAAPAAQHDADSTLLPSEPEGTVTDSGGGIAAPETPGPVATPMGLPAAPSPTPAASATTGGTPAPAATPVPAPPPAATPGPAPTAAPVPAPPPATP